MERRQLDSSKTPHREREREKERVSTLECLNPLGNLGGQKCDTFSAEGGNPLISERLSHFFRLL